MPSCLSLMIRIVVVVVLELSLWLCLCLNCSHGVFHLQQIKSFNIFLHSFYLQMIFKKLVQKLSA